MARISQQWKDALTVVITIGVGAVTGFLVDELTKHESYTLSLLSLIALAIAQLFLTFFVPSKEATDLEQTLADLAACRKDLEVYRKGERTELEIRNAMAEQALKSVKEGNLSEALQWREASDRHTPGKETK